ncbi:MAG: hypothetical protein ACLU1S_01075 [Eubacterium sp.]
MKLPELQPIKAGTVNLDAFNGINDNVYIPEGYFKDMKNMSSDYYPALGQRDIREQYKLTGNINGAITVNDTLYTVVGTKMYKNGAVISGLTVTDSKKQLLGYGAYIVIMPDRIMYNTKDGKVSNMYYKKVVDMSKEGIEKSNEKAEIYLSDKDGNPYVIITSESENITLGKEDGDTKIKEFIDKTKPNYPDFATTVNALSGAKSILKQYVSEWGGKYKLGFVPLTSEHKIGIEYYNESMDMWSSPTLYITYYIKASSATEAQNIAGSIKEGDFVKIEASNTSGTVVKKGQISNTVYGFYQKFANPIKVEKVLRKNNDVGLIFANTGIDFLEYVRKRGNYRVGNIAKKATSGSDDGVELVTGIKSATFRYSMPDIGETPSFPVSNLKKDVPAMDYVTVADNRIWGCSNSAHEIYACKQGDPTNWYSYAGISTDSYAVTIGSDGEFTGCCTYKGTPYFFKEDLIIIMYGSKPSNYQVSEIFSQGIEKGSSESIIYLNGAMYYKARKGIVRFDGSNVTTISEELGKKRFKNAVASASDSKYFVSMLENDKPHLFVYNSDKGMWHIEDDFRPDFFFKFGATVCGVRRTDSMVYRIDGLDDITKKLPSATKKMEIEEKVAVGNLIIYNRGLEWYAETGPIEKGSVNAKYIQRLGIRYELQERAFLTVKVQYDNDSEWQEVFTHEGRKGEGAVSVPFRPCRCEKFRLRFEGKGKCLIHNIQRSVYEGSDVRHGNF